MKKLASFLLALALAVSFIGCDEEQPSDDTTEGRVEAPGNDSPDTIPSQGSVTTAPDTTKAPETEETTKAPETTAPVTEVTSSGAISDGGGYFPQGFDSLDDMLASIGDGDKVSWEGGKFWQLGGLPDGFEESSCEYNWYDSYTITYSKGDELISFRPASEQALREEMENVAFTNEFTSNGREFKLEETLDKDGNFASARVYVLDANESYVLGFTGIYPEAELVAGTDLEEVKAR